MEIYLVGGAVRDFALGRTPKDFDFVVVNGTHEDMINRGFLQVGQASFPVYLHPITKDEFALARTDSKSGDGYNGFSFDTDSISLELDLKRRDLTINAMAMKCDWEAVTKMDSFRPGDIIDYHGGLKDIQDKILRNVGDSFWEDPLRVLRTARFQARLGRDWSITDQMKSIMDRMYVQGELKHLSGERIWKETSRALMEDHPSEYFNVLSKYDIFPELFPKESNISNMLLSFSGSDGLTLEERFAILCKRIDGNNQASMGKLNDLCERIKPNGGSKKLAKLIVEYQYVVPLLPTASPLYIVDVLNKMDSFRKPDQLKSFLSCLRNGADKKTLAGAQLLEDSHTECSSINAKNVMDKNPTIRGKSIGLALNEIRGEAVQGILNQTTDRQVNKCSYISI